MLVVSYNPGYQNLLKGMKPSTRQRFVSLRFDFPDSTREAVIVQRKPAVPRIWRGGWWALPTTCGTGKIRIWRKQSVRAC